MKLETNLRHHGGFLFLGPVINAVLIVLFFFVLSSSLVVRSGVTVNLPESGASLQPFADPLLINISAGAGRNIYLDDQPVEMSQLGERLGALREHHGQVIIQADVLAPYGLVMQVANLALEQGFSLAFATRGSHSPGL
jgi:biopolymer transport protein ExbD